MVRINEQLPIPTPLVSRVCERWLSIRWYLVSPCQCEHRILPGKNINSIRSLVEEGVIQSGLGKTFI